MTLPTAAGLAAAMLLAISTPQDSAQGSPFTKPAGTLGAANVESLSKLVHSYQVHSETPGEDKKARADLDKLREETAKLAKSLKVNDTLVALDDWREIMRRADVVEKPAANVTWRQELRVADFAFPHVGPASDDKNFKDYWDGRLKALVSVPSDVAKVAYPVLLVLHPIDDETDKGLKDLKKSKAIVDSVKTWAAGAISKELLAKAIVVVPIMDVVIRGTKPLVFSRPHWDEERENSVGPACAIQALSELVLKAMNYDSRRIYVDGYGNSSTAALEYVARWPGFATGAIVRAAPDAAVDLQNCSGAPILCLGAETKPLFEKWGKKDGFQIVAKDSPDLVVDGATQRDAVLLQWMAEHPKNYAPLRVHLDTKSISQAAAYWMCVTYDDPNQAKVDDLRIEAVVDRDKNEISVVTNPKVKEFLIFLNDDLVSLDKEIVVLHAREGEEKPVERFRGTRKRLLEEVFRNRKFVSNTGEVYVAQIKIEL